MLNKVNSAPGDREESPVLTTMRYLGASLDLYSSILDRAENQLNHVLTPLDAKSDGSNKSATLYEAGRSDLHAELQRMHRFAEAMNERFISLLDRSTV